MKHHFSSDSTLTFQFPSINSNEILFQITYIPITFLKLFIVTTFSSGLINETSIILSAVFD